MAEAKAEEVKTEEGPVFSVTQWMRRSGGEGRSEGGGGEWSREWRWRRPVGEEIEMVENRVVEEAGHRAPAYGSPHEPAGGHPTGTGHCERSRLTGPFNN